MSDEQDIVQRLRTWPKVSGLCLDTDLMRQAADEIERLRPLTFCGCGDQFSAHDPGLGYVQIDGAPVLSDHACPACDGTGKRSMLRALPDTRESTLEASRWLVAEIERLVTSVHSDMARMLSQRIEL